MDIKYMINNLNNQMIELGRKANNIEIPSQETIEKINQVKEKFNKEIEAYLKSVHEELSKRSEKLEVIEEDFDEE